MSDKDNITPEEMSADDLRRRERLVKHTALQATRHTQRYTKFIRHMRLFLPLLAVVIIVALLTWPKDKENIVAEPEEQAEQYKNVQKNELLNPKFESVDEKNQPYTVTADKAIQNDENKDMLTLTNPVGEILLNDDTKATLSAKTGYYQQELKKLHLEEDVHLTHNETYEMTTSELFIDMDAGTALSEKEVQGNGPEGSITAKGVHADQKKNQIIFRGPAKLILTDSSFMDNLSSNRKTSGSTPLQKEE